jgi:NAD+ kinase
MSKVGLVAHHDRAQAGELAQRAVIWLEERGHRVVMVDDDAVVLGLGELACGPDFGAEGLDLVVSLGGDGTVLRAVELVDGADTPLLGVNVGQLGYLTAVEPASMELALDAFFTDGHTIEERMLVDVEVETAGGIVRTRALNDAVIEKREGSHTVRLLVSIDGAVFTSYAADGLIVATPTGSTAYALSARGPIVSPRHRALLLTPVSPHMLFDRTLVLDPVEEVEIEVIGTRTAQLFVDGREGPLLVQGDRLRCRASAVVARFVQYGHRDFHAILKAKFGLSDR